jgi:hypothetical protein
MGRFATAAIIALALAGAAVESHAGDLTGAAQDNRAVSGPGVPVEQLLADAGPTPAAAPTATPMPVPDAPPPPPRGPMGAMPPPPGPMGWDARDGMRGAQWRMHEMVHTWGLFFNQRDKNLSNNDVQVLAEAILLVHGNHDWKVTNVADAADGQATFAYATGDGSVIARFSIDRHTGRITRIG